MVVTRSYSGTASASVGVGAEADINGVLASAKLTVSASVTTTTTVSATHEFHHDIRPKHYGNVRYYAYGKRISYRKYRLNVNCSTSTLNTGIISYPGIQEGWYY